MKYSNGIAKLIRNKATELLQRAKDQQGRAKPKPLPRFGLGNASLYASLVESETLGRTVLETPVRTGGHTDADELVGDLAVRMNHAAKVGDQSALDSSGIAETIKEVSTEITALIRSGKTLFSGDRLDILARLVFIAENLENCSLNDLAQDNRLNELFIALKVIVSEFSGNDIYGQTLETLSALLSKIRTESKTVTDSQMPAFLSDSVCGLSLLLISVGPSSFEAGINIQVSDYGKNEYARINQAMRQGRKEIFKTFAAIFELEVFTELSQDLKSQVLALLKPCYQDALCYSSARTALVRDAYDVINQLRYSTSNDQLRAVMGRIYWKKPLGFGTSGVRARMELGDIAEFERALDFSPAKALMTAEAIADYMEQEALVDKGRTVVIASDPRRGADMLTKLCAIACLKRGYKVHLFQHAVPTGAALDYGLRVVGRENLAAVINVTPSHNPLPWQGIRISMADGAPAGANVTGWITKRLNERTLCEEYDRDISRLNWVDHLNDPTIQQLFNGYKGGLLTAVGSSDPKTWGNIPEAKIAPPHERYVEIASDVVSMVFGEGIQQEIADFFSGKVDGQKKFILADSLCGAAAGYIPEILGRMGVPKECINTLHEEGGLRKPNLLETPSNPERKKYLGETLTEAKRISQENNNAPVVFLVQDTDGDRGVAGVVIGDSEHYFSANRLFSMLGVGIITDKNSAGRKIITTKSDPSTLWVDIMMQKLKGTQEFGDRIVTPEELPIKGYEVPGNPAHRAAEFVPIMFNRDIRLVTTELVELLTGVGFKKLTANMLNALDVRSQFMLGKDAEGNQMRINLAMGFEESAGFGVGLEVKNQKGEVVRRFIPDKDGVIGSLLCIALQARQRMLLTDYAVHLEQEYGKLESTRMDVIASTGVKMGVINDILEAARSGQLDEIAGIRISEIDPILGGIYYNSFEFIFQDAKTGLPVLFKFRMSGTEPLLRVYIEAPTLEMKERLLTYAQSLVLRRTVTEISRAESLGALVDILSVTQIIEQEGIRDEDDNPITPNFAALKQAVVERMKRPFVDGHLSFTQAVENFVGPTPHDRNIFDAPAKVKYAGDETPALIAAKLRRFAQALEG